MDMAMVGIASSFEQKYMYSSTYSVSLFDQIVHPRKDAQNDGLEKVTPFKHDNSWYLC